METEEKVQKLDPKKEKENENEKEKEKEVEEKYRLLTNNLQEIVGGDGIKPIIRTRAMKIYWGTAPTGAPHLGYMVPILKIGDFLRAGMEVTVLFADVHAVLDNLKSSFEQVGKRTVYYEFLIKLMLKSVGVKMIHNLKFVKGSSFQFSKEYTMNVYKLASITSLSKAKHSGADVVKKVSDPLLSGLMYPILQALDEQFLEVDAQFGGIDQRKIFMYARDMLPRVGFKKRIHLMNYLIPGLTKSGKMSASIPNSKIDFFDSDEVIRKKISEAFSIDGVSENNSLLCLLKFIIMDRVKSQKRKLVIKRPEKFGGNVEYADFGILKKDFEEEKLVSADLKMSVAEEIILLIKPIRKVLYENRKLFEEAYPKKQLPKSKEELAAEALKKKNFVKTGKKANKKKQKKNKNQGVDILLDELVEKHKGEFKALSGKKLRVAVRKKYNVFRIFHTLSAEEKDKYNKMFEEKKQ